MSPSFCCRRSAQSSTRSRTSGSSCATTGSPTASSNPTTISSTIVVRHGTSSSISLGASCPSDCANGPTGSDQWDLVLVELLPSNLSPASSYVKAFLVYFCVLALFYIVICFLFSTATGVLDVVFGEGTEKTFRPAEPKPGRSLGAPEIPLVVALLMVGLFPKYRHFGEFEAPLRRFS